MNKATEIKIKQRMDRLLEQGCTDKQDIYSKIVEEFGIPRPIVRRIARDFRNEINDKIKILQSEIPHEIRDSIEKDTKKSDPEERWY